MSRTRARSWALAVACAAGLALPAAPAGAADPCDGGAQTSPAVLCGETTLSGSQTAGVKVRLTKEAAFDPGGYGQGNWPAGSVDIQGGGPFVGYAIKGASASTSGLFLIGGRLPASAPDRDLFLEWSSGTAACSGACVLPAGDYTFVLLAAGSHASVRFTFDGLEGSTALAPGAAASARVASLPVHIGGTPGNVVYSAGETYTMAEAGEAILITWFLSDWFKASAHGVCILESGAWDEEIPAAVTYGPGCPGRNYSGGAAYSAGGATWAWDPTTPGEFAWQTTATSEEGTLGSSAGGSDQHDDSFGLGSWIAGAGDIHTAEAVGIWIA